MTSTPAASGRPTLVVLGSEAAGVDLLARVLHLCGAQEPAGASALALADGNAEALTARGSHVGDLFGPRGGTGALDDAETEGLARRLAAAAAGDPRAPLLLREAGTTFLAALWAGALRRAALRPVFLIPVADPADAAAALKADRGQTHARGLLLWTAQMLSAERATRGERRVFVDLGRLQAEPERQLDRIERALGARLPRRSWDAAAEVEDLLHDEARTRRHAPATVPAALAPVRTLHAHLVAAAEDAPENADVSAEVAGWFDALEQAVAPVLKELERELRRQDGAGRAPTAVTQGAPVPPQPAPDDDRAERAERRAEELDQALKAARRDLAEALDRAHGQEAQATIAEAQVGVLRRRAAEAEELLQARLIEAQARERAARETLADALAGRQAAEARELKAAEARELQAAEDARHARMQAEAVAIGAAQAVEEARREHESRLGEVREQLAVSGVTGLAALARVSELEARLAQAQAEIARRRRWWLGPFAR